MKTPCKDCPFRSDVNFYLSEPRARQIANDVILGDGSFPCHKTTHNFRKGQFDYLGKEKPCNGAMLAIEKERGDARANLWVRMGVMLGAIDVDSLDRSVSVRNAQEFVEDLS